jgi:hypothetical protein
MSEYLKEIIRLEGQIIKMEATLSDEKFMSKAPPNVIELNKKKLADFNNVLNRTMDELVGKLRARFDYNDGLEGVDAPDRLGWQIEWMREQKYLNDRKITLEECEFDKEYFDYVYNIRATKAELAELCDLTDGFSMVSQGKTVIVMSSYDVIQEDGTVVNTYKDELNKNDKK